MTKKFISLVLSLVLVIGLIPMMSVNAESTVVTHFDEDFETWAEDVKFGEDKLTKSTIYINSAGDANKTASKVTNIRFSTGSKVTAEVVNVIGYDGEYTHAFKYMPRSDAAAWDLSAAASSPGGSRIVFNPEVALPQSDATLIYEVKLYIPEDEHDIQKFNFGPIVKYNDKIGDGLKATAASDYESCATYTPGWNKLTAVMVPYTRNAIIYLNDECVGYKRYEHGGAINQTYANGLTINSYQVTDWADKYIYIDDWKVYSNPDATTASSVFSDAQDVAINAKPTVEFSQKVLGKTINADATVTEAATIEFTNLSDGTQVEVANAEINNNKLTITPEANLLKGTTYQITVSDVKDMYDQVVAPITFTFTTEQPQDITAGDPVFSIVNLSDNSASSISTLQNGLIKGTFTFENEGAEAQDAVIIAVLRDEGAIKAFTFEERTIPAGETLTFNGGFQVDDYANQSIEIYVWNNLSSMTPLVDAKYVFDKDSSAWE